MKRVVILIAALATVMAGGTAAASAHSAKLQLHNTKKGKILVDGAGFTLYMFAKDARNTNDCVKIRECMSVWPALTTGGKPIAGPGVRASLIGTISVPHVGRQVTYAGHPLYLYIADSGPAQTSYIGINQFGARWYGVNARGTAVK